MRITLSECDDEEDDLPVKDTLNNKTQETDKVLLAAGSKRKINEELSSKSTEILSEKRKYFPNLPSVSSTKLNRGKYLGFRNIKSKKRFTVLENFLLENENKTIYDYVEQCTDNEKKPLNSKILNDRKRKYNGTKVNSVHLDQKLFKSDIDDCNGTLLTESNNNNLYLTENNLNIESENYTPLVRKFFKTGNRSNHVSFNTILDKSEFDDFIIKKKKSRDRTEESQQINKRSNNQQNKKKIKDKSPSNCKKIKKDIKETNNNQITLHNNRNIENSSIERDCDKNLKLLSSTPLKNSPENKENLPIQVSNEHSILPSPSLSVNENTEKTVDKSDDSKKAEQYYHFPHSFFGQISPKSIKSDTLILSSSQKINNTASDFGQQSHKNNLLQSQDETTALIINNNNFCKTQTSKAITMSMYDRRIQADDRPINGYTSSRGIHNEDSTTSGSISNHHYYQCSPPQQPTMATLCNIGNTCYLNSVVYTLRFAPMFLHNLHHLVDLSSVQQNLVKYHLKSSSLGRNISGLHMENTRSWSSKDLASLENVSCDMPKSSQQIATEKLHELYQSLHQNEYTETTEPFHADTFLHAIQDVNAIFEGNQQQDAHEFLMCVLNSIREACQSSIKAISECPDVITNGCISLPEQKESQCTTAVKEKPMQRDTSSSAIIKTSFFSRKSKRKNAELKSSKNTVDCGNRIQSPHKDNTQMTPSSDAGVSGSSSDALNGPKHSLKINSIPENELPSKDKEQLKDKIKKLGLDFFTEDFEGITVSTTKCLSCETITEQKETMIDVAVPITRYENVELSEKFIQDSCVTKEYFRGENKYHCERCMGYTEAIRSISYEVLPRLLIIQLSRFSGVMEKINTYLPTPFTLQCFCSKCLGSSPDNKNSHIYKLYSVITHVGATMSVGHYIAYTCSLDWTNDYINCPKDRIHQAQLIKQQQQQQVNVNRSNSSNVSNGPEKNVRLVKKMIFGRSKASSSGDMSKTVKSINGLSSNKSITTNGGIDNKHNNANVICPSINCCGLQFRNNYLMNSNYNSSSNSSGIGGNINNSNSYYIEFDDTQTNSSSSSGYNSNNYNSNNTQNCTNGGNSRNRIQQSNEPIWFMCDDDKIKAMSQREFEDMLSPNRKNMITPYLLFYARSDVQ